MSSRFLIAGRYCGGQVVALVESVPGRCPRGTLIPRLRATCSFASNVKNNILDGRNLRKKKILVPG